MDTSLIIDNLTHAQEELLKDFHADQCEGITDDDMPDNYESWLTSRTLEELQDMLGNTLCPHCKGTGTIATMGATATDEWDIIAIKPCQCQSE